MALASAKEWTRHGIGSAVLALCVCLLGPRPGAAQDFDIDAQFKAVSAEEDARLRQILATPLNTQALRSALQQQVTDKRMAAKKLGLRDAEEAVLKEALQWLADPGPVNDLAIIARNRGDFSQAIELHRQAVDLAPRVRKPFFMVHLANDYLEWGKDTLARETLNEALPRIEALQREPWGLGQQIALQRSVSYARLVQSQLEQRQGHWDRSVQAAHAAAQAARKALAMHGNRPKDMERLNVVADLANALTRRTQALRTAGRWVDASESLREYLKFASEVELPANFRSGMYRIAADLHLAKREFEQAERFARRSDEVLEGLGYDPLRTDRIQRRQGLLTALAGQKKWPEARAELDRLDQLAQGLPSAAERVRLGFERAYVYLGNQEPELAAPLFEQVAIRQMRVHGEGHYFVAQARGLQGVALWRQGDTSARLKALDLLTTAVNDLVSSRNADYLDQTGLRPEIRQLIVGTAIEAAAELAPARVLQLLGLADWLRAGTVQEALTDAAVRASAQTQGLSELVRKDQDAKNELRALRDYLQGEAGQAASSLPQVAAQMRERIATLEKARHEVQSQIKKGFPGYERLVRPLPPSLDDIAQKLTTQEALVVVMPDANGVNVWVVRQQEGQAQARFHRTALTETQLTRQVDDLRRSLESLGSQGIETPFDDRLAHETYARLLAPVADLLKDRTQWVIAASGPLARLPLAVLQTSPRLPNAPPAWLIRQASLTQVPSVASWLSLRSLPRRTMPSSALMAWGDPVFKPGSSPDTRAGRIHRALAAQSVNDNLEAEPVDGAKVYHAIPPLPETREELHDLARALKADPTRDLILGAAATRASVLQANASGQLADRQVLAFATHGLMAGDLPRLTQPALALSADGSEMQDTLSPLLTLEDVLGLKLNADWVVLSACNTAATDGKAEEALSGLARGFFYAGGRSLLVTQWAVESESAKELTTRTLAHFMGHPQAPKAESLRQAMLQVMAQPPFAHPAFWAPYVLVGDSMR
jgi:CHAT domain-containing protein